MKSIIVSASICIICTLFYGLGFLKFLTDFEDKCEMTYMFEYPQFVRVSQEIDELYPKYGLYAYSEGRFTSNARKMYFDGIPVLFVPGNAGSHKQVRSLSSVALRKMIDGGIPYHFDYFTLDLNNELSGLYGPLLYDQLDYLRHSLNRILELYNNRKKRPSSVVIIGHSMGGILALKLLSETEDQNLIPILITLSTPLRRPVTILDYSMKLFYENITDRIPDSTTVINLSGGYSDFLIPASLTNLATNTSLYAVTTNVPRTWVETNHVQILWCKQLVLAINRALFDIVDTKTKQISTSSVYRKKVFEHYLYQHSGIKIRNHNRYSEEVVLDNRGQWIENIKKQYSLKLLRGTKENHWYMVKLDSLPGYELISILAINLKTTDWVYVCNAYALRGSSRLCVESHHLTQHSDIAPSVKYKRRYFETNLHELRKNYSDSTHLVFRTQPTDEPVVFHVDIHAPHERKFHIELPKWWSMGMKVLIDKTAENAVRYDLVLADLVHIVQYYLLYIEPLSCNNEFYHVSASLIVPWSQETRHSFFTNTDRKPANIRLYSSKPRFAGDQAAFIRIILDPECTYRISLKPSIQGSLGQIARTYSPLLLTNVAVIILMSLRHQLQCLEKNNRCSLLFVSLKDGAIPYYIFFIWIVISHINEPAIRNFVYPKPDILYMIEEGTSFSLLPLLMYISSIGFMFVMAVIFGISLVALESSIHKLALKLLARTVSFNMAWSDYVMSALHRVPLAVAIVLIFLSVSTCGGLALCLGAIFYFLRLTQMSKDFVEEVVWFFVKKIGRKLRKYLRSFSKKPKKEKNVDDKKAGVVADKTEPNINETQPSISVSSKTKQIDLVSTEYSVATPASINQTDPKEEMIEFSSAYNTIFFHTSLFFIWFILAIINIPAVLTWAHNFKFNKVLTPDESFIPGVTLSVCAIPLWQFEFPKPDRKWFGHLQVFVFAIAVTSLLFAMISVYRLNYLLTLIILVITCQQALAPKIRSTSDDDDKKDEDIRDVYDKAKSKME